jgi:D-psicose/D-tagatose/L-ribulose 3-epimerase
MQMKYGVNTWAWESPLTTETFEQLVPTAAELGFDVIEIPFSDLDTYDFDRMATLLTEYDLEVSAIPTGYDLIHEDREIRSEGVEFLEECIHGMSVMDGKHLGVPMAVYNDTTRFGKSPEERERDLERLAGALESLSETAAAHDVVLGVEPLNRFETNLINTTEEGIDLVDRVDHDACTLLLDPFHMNIEEKDICEAIQAAGSRLSHFHACANDRGTPGSGHIPWEGIAATFEDIGFTGPVVIETFTPYADPIASTECVWRPLAPTQDDIVEDGFAFLQEQLGE